MLLSLATTADSIVEPAAEVSSIMVSVESYMTDSHQPLAEPVVGDL